jgi:hypothetical protein
MASIPNANRLYFIYSSAEASGSGFRAGSARFKFGLASVESVELCRDTRTASRTSGYGGEAGSLTNTTGRQRKMEDMEGHMAQAGCVEALRVELRVG